MKNRISHQGLVDLESQVDKSCHAAIMLPMYLQALEHTCEKPGHSIGKEVSWKHLGKKHCQLWSKILVHNHLSATACSSWGRRCPGVKQPHFSQHWELSLPTLPELIPSSSQRYLFEQWPAKLCCGSLAGQGVLPGQGCVGSDQHCSANILKRSQRGKPVRGTIFYFQHSNLMGAKKQSRECAGASENPACYCCSSERCSPVCTIRTIRDQC